MRPEKIYMLHTVSNFSALGIVEAIHGTDKVAGNPPDTLKVDTFAEYNIATLLHVYAPTGFTGHGQA